VLVKKMRKKGRLTGSKHPCLEGYLLSRESCGTVFRNKCRPR
jgi:hypothetical protein